MSENRPRVVAIVGPTGVGKSRLGMRLAAEFNGEIVSADSRQVYRHMNIGTAKPTEEDRAGVRHHLVDCVAPDGDFGLPQYQALAGEAIEAIIAAGRLPLLVGGTGQYVWALLEGWQIPRVPPDAALRQRLEERAGGDGAGALYQELADLDPESARRIDPRNVRRVIRALEVTLATGTPFSRLRRRQAPPFESLIIGLTMERLELRRRTDLRVDGMIADGLVEEVKRLVQMGYGLELPAMSGIGYREIGEYLEGRASLDEAVGKIKAETHRLIRQQYNWFRLSDSRISWFDATDPATDGAVAGLVGNFIPG